MPLRKETAQQVINKLSSHVAGIRDFDPSTSRNDVLLTQAAQDALGDDMMAKLREEQLVETNGELTRLKLAELRQIAESQQEAAAAVGAAR